MKFRTAYSSSIRFNSPSGSRFRQKYIKQIMPDGTSKLVEDGMEDVYDSIQKAGMGLGIEDLIRRAKSGDTTAIREPIDSYADLTHAPKDLLEAHSMLSDAHNKYNALPAELRSKFGNSFEKFLQASVDGSVIRELAQPAKKADTVSPLTAEEITKFRESLGGNANA